MPGQSLIGSVATFDELERDVPREAGVDEPGGRVRQQPEPPERALALEARRDVVGQRDELERRPEHELAGVQDERLVRLRLDQVRQVGLVLGRVDERVLVVVEQPEEPVEPHVDARRLDHLAVERLEPDAPGVEFGPDVAVAQQHWARTIDAPVRLVSARHADVVQWQNFSFPS